MNRIQLALTLLALFAAAALAADDDAIKAEIKNFEGSWQLISAVKDGVETPEDVVKKIRVIIKDGHHTVYFGDDVVAKEIAFTIDITKTPKTTVDNLPEGKQIKGIYKIDGDTLTSCVSEIGKDHPTEFSAKAGTGKTLRVFKRIKS